MYLISFVSFFWRSGSSRTAGFRSAAIDLGNLALRGTYVVSLFVLSFGCYSFFAGRGSFLLRALPSNTKIILPGLSVWCGLLFVEPIRLTAKHLSSTEGDLEEQT